RCGAVSSSRPPRSLAPTRKPRSARAADEPRAAPARACEGSATLPQCQAAARRRAAGLPAGAGARFFHLSPDARPMSNDTTPAAIPAASLSVPRAGVLQLVFKEKAALYAAYMPFIDGGGLFVPTTRPANLG